MLEFLCLFSSIKNFTFFWKLSIFHQFHLSKAWERVFNFDGFFDNHSDAISVKSMSLTKLF